MWLLRAAGILFFTFALALSARVRIPLPYTPVPLTLQTLAVILAGGTLGWRWGGAAAVFYLILGGLGSPVFAGGTAGWAVLAGPTAGYLIGFVPAAMVAGLAFGRGWPVRLLCYLLSIGVIFTFGTFYLAVVWRAGWAAAFRMGVAPFIIGDLLKVAVAVVAQRPLVAVGRLFIPGRGAL